MDGLTGLQEKMRELMKQGDTYFNSMRKFAKLETILDPEKVVDKEKTEDKKEGESDVL